MLLAAHRLRRTDAMTFLLDLKIIAQRDPAARNWLEILFCYPGLQAIWLHRLSHGLYRLKIPFLPRLVAHLGRFFTGIEIHPGAQIGRGVFIDHGMGVVIGETAIVGDYAVIYQGVTLGGTGKEVGKRHPTLGQHVVVGAGAKVLGNIQIGDHVRIGAASVVLRDVPSHSTVVGIPGRIMQRKSEAVDALAQDNPRDVQAEVIQLLFNRVKELEQQVELLQAQQQEVLAHPVYFQAIDRTPRSRREGLLTAVPGETKATRTASNLVIEEFLNGAGI